MTTNSSFNTFFKLIKVRDEHWSNFRYTLFNVLGLIRQHYKSGSVIHEVLDQIRDKFDFIAIQKQLFS